MARKRLSLTGPFGAAGDPLEGAALPPLETKSALGPPPIARVAAEASASAALTEMTEAWTQARDSGRLIQSLPLSAIDESWLVRDRLTPDTEETADLVASIRSRGQQVPIEVVALENGRFGLISGWRRLRALKALNGAGDEADPDRFAQVLAILRRPDSAAEAYRAMVEENEIRANLSYYERARIAARAAAAGAFADARAAIAALFAAGSRARRSKIGSFLTLVEALDDRLRFGWAIPERLGLQLARALEEDPDLAPRLRERLRKGAADSAEQELALLGRALARPKAAPPAPARHELRPGLWLETAEGPGGPRLILGGPRVDAALRGRLTDWLQRED